MITFLKSGFIVSVSFISWISLNNTWNFVDFAGESSGRDKSWKLTVNEISGNTKLVCHWLELDSFVWLQKLGVNNHSSLSDEISRMWVNVFVIFDVVDNPQEVNKKVTISAVVKTFQVILNLRQFHQINNNLTRLQDFLLYRLPVHTYDSCDNCVSYQSLIIHYFSCVECGKHIDEKLCCSFEISDNQFVNSFVYF